MVGGTTATWIDDLWHDPRYAWADPETDAARIAHAFRQLRRHAERWPTLADFARALPEPPQRDALTYKPLDDAKAAEKLMRLNAWIQNGMRGEP